VRKSRFSAKSAENETCQPPQAVSPASTPPATRPALGGRGVQDVPTSARPNLCAHGEHDGAQNPHFRQVAHLRARDERDEEKARG